MFYGYIASVLDGTETVLNEETYKSLPVPKEYSYLPYMSPVLNQGAESTCVPHSISAIYDYYYAMRNPESAINGIFTHTDMSIHQIYDARSNKGEGMSYRDALEFCKNHGVGSEKDYKTKTEGDIIKIADYARICSLDMMKKSIVMNGPCLIATYVRDTKRFDFWNGRGNYGGHATSVIGYSDRKGALLVRNSWGRSWGERGYTWLPYTEYSAILEAWAVLG